MKKEDPQGPKPTSIEEANRAIIRDRQNIAATEADEFRTEAHVHKRRPLVSPHE